MRAHAYAKSSPHVMPEGKTYNICNTSIRVLSYLVLKSLQQRRQDELDTRTAGTALAEVPVCKIMRQQGMSKIVQALKNRTPFLLFSHIPVKKRERVIQDHRKHIFKNENIKNT